jgi:hypothetical protein
MLEAAIAIGAALLPTLIEEIGAALGEGLDEKAATERALERMRARAIPASISAEIADKYRRARADEPTQEVPLVPTLKR